MNSFKPPSQRQTRRVRDRKQPNVLWLFGDQHRHHALGCMGDPNLHTPNFDQLALTGFTLARGAVSGYPLCCPFRGSLLTGVYPHRCIPVHEAPLPDGMPTIAQPFNEAGYDTAWFGKWHVDGCTEAKGQAAYWVVPPERRGGFKEWVGYENNNNQFDTWVHGGRNGECEPRKLDGFETDALTDLLIDYLERRAEDPDAQPFFAALSVQPPHWPLQCPPEYHKLRPDEVQLRPNVPPGGSAEAGARLGTPGYAGLIENWDMNVGRIIAALRRLDLAESTHIVFFADHGEMLGSHGHFGKVLPYDESIRVPFILGGADFFYHGLASCEGPTRGGPLPAGTDAPINHVDIAPTTLGLCGIPVPDWMEGHDYSYLRRGETPPAESPDCALIQAIEPREESPAYRAIVTRNGWKYAETAEGPWLMFNLNDDPNEMANLAHHPGHAARRAELQLQLREKMKEVGDPGM
ncbi:MAG: sulfatase-like hydrolase/transferase [Verrucomicrobia bacterium]|nr:sulfatase-like hydrolase/transferase [Verrucomicrobiota bacterium]MCH8513475.1 sulfatase [Kiritimatiellia bacterium]